MSDDVILLGHGGGGELTRRLVAEVLAPPLANPVLAQMDDAAEVDLDGARLALTTDSFVVDPLFFPGGSIGTLAVCGTVNDLAMQGAEPKYLTLGMILEEGFPVADLRRIVADLAAAAKRAGVLVAAGDTKVVERGKGGGVYLNTAGIGVRLPGVSTHVRNAQPGDAVILSGTLGDHGIAVISQRQGLSFETTLETDAAPLWELVRPLLERFPKDIHVLRDPTRGGLTAALCDVTTAAGCGIRLHEKDIPIRPAVRGACGLLGLDPLTVANEGKAIVICAEAVAADVLALLRDHPLGRDAVRIGTVTDKHPGLLILETGIGGERILLPPAGEDLPRIC